MELKNYNYNFDFIWLRGTQRRPNNEWIDNKVQQGKHFAKFVDQLEESTVMNL